MNKFALIYFIGFIFAAIFYFSYSEDRFYKKEAAIRFEGKEMTIPMGYFADFKYPVSGGDVDSVSLWFLLPDMEPLSRGNKEHFASGKNRNQRVVKVWVRSVSYAGSNSRLVCDLEFDGRLVVCRANKDKLIIKVQFSGLYVGVKDELVGRVFEKINSFFK